MRIQNKSIATGRTSQGDFMSINYHKYAIVRVALAAVLMAGLIHVRPAKAESIDFGWVEGGAGGASLDYGTALAVDASGNAYFTGFVTNDPSNEDAFLNKWDADGNFIWANIVAGPGHDVNHAVALDEDGNVYVSGAFSDTVEFDAGNNAGDLTSAGSTDAFVVKYDSAGGFVWVKGVGGTSDEGAHGMTVDGNGNIYLTGIYAGTVDFDPSGSVSNFTSAGFADVFVVKLDGDGNFIWAKSMGGAAGENSFDIAVDANGNVFTTGYFNGTADFDPGAGTSNLTSNGQGDIFLSKLDNSGNFLWARRAGEMEFDTGTEVTVDGNGNAYLSGYVNFNILITKWDPDGNLLWTNVMGGPGVDAAYGTTLDQYANVYITGEFGGTVDFDPGAGISDLTSAGGNDVFVSKLDTDGNFLWAKQLGGTSMDLGEAIVVRNDGSLYLAGAFSDTVDFDLGAGTTTLTSGGSMDPFLTRQNITAQTHYVKWNATGTNDGSSWANAYTDLQPALAAASSGDEIWVAAGTYKPTSTTDRTISFNLKNGVAIYGGFAGTEPSRAQRNPQTNLTVLSGDIGAGGNNGDNSYHVLVGSNTDNSAILDGFTITAGNANDVSSLYNSGGGMYIDKGAPRLNGLIFTDNHAGFGGGIYTSDTGADDPVADLVLTYVVFRDNSATWEGGGLALRAENIPYFTVRLRLTDVLFENNTAARTGGGLINYGGELQLLDVTFLGNTALGGGGLSHLPLGPSTLTNVTFSNNYGRDGGGGMLVGSSGPTLTTLTNVTFNNNSTALKGGGIANAGDSNLDFTNATFSDNTAGESGGGLSNGGIFDLETDGTVNLVHTTFSNNTATSQESAIYNEGGNLNIHNSILYGDTGHEIVNNAGTAAVTYSIVQGGYTGAGNLDANPLLGPLQDNGGFTQTMSLGASSPAIDSADDTICPATDQRGVTRPHGAHCDMGAYEYDSSDSTVDVTIGNSTVDSYVLSPQESIRDSYPGVNDGPVKISNADNVSMIAAERVIYKVNGVNTSFSEMMGLPASQLDNTYWLPWYNNVDFDTQLRFANVSGSQTTVTVTIGGVPKPSFNLAAGESTRLSYPGVNNGPVKIESTQNLVAAERVIYKVNGVNTSFSEMMALPHSQLDNTYWLPWYNNVDLDTQLRIANVSGSQATVTVTIGGVPRPSFNLAAGASTRLSYPGINSGPVKIVSTQDIVAAERVIYRVNGVNTSFSEMMALPNRLLDTIFWLPWYNNKDLDTQLRIANVSTSPATVTVTIGGVPQPSFNLAAGASTRLSYPGVSNGPVRIVSTHGVPIVAAERVIYKVNGVNTSFSEMMGLPDNLLDTTFWFPWYNNVDLDTQLRFGVP
jgi:hypothetical protein